MIYTYLCPIFYDLRPFSQDDLALPQSIGQQRGSDCVILAAVWMKSLLIFFLQSPTGTRREDFCLRRPPDPRKWKQSKEKAV